MKAELIGMGAEKIPISFSSMGGGGAQAKHRLQISATGAEKFKIASILSEGEQRVIALAGFFAELTLEPNKNPIVFDDPVTSLDHKFREKIAERISTESLARQVIVFTHDISFLIYLEEKLSSKPGSLFSVITIDRVAEKPGFCHGIRPWHTMKVQDRIGVLRDELGKLNPVYQSDRKSYNEPAAIIYGKMRETWEAAIEECLFNKVLRRHSSEIHPLSLREVHLRDEEFYLLMEHFDVCCSWMIGHDKSKTLDCERPAPDEIKNGIDAIETFRKQADVTRKLVGSNRKWPKSPAVG